MITQLTGLWWLCFGKSCDLPPLFADGALERREEPYTALLTDLHWLQVVLKPSELTPLTALALAALAERAGVPQGVLNIVVGDAKPIGDALLASDAVGHHGNGL